MYGNYVQTYTCVKLMSWQVNFSCRHLCKVIRALGSLQEGCELRAQQALNGSTQWVQASFQFEATACLRRCKHECAMQEAEMGQAGVQWA